jgi:hypothetical protein
MARRPPRVENHVEVAAHHRDGVAHLGARIGANTAIFNVVNAALFRPLPFHDPQQLVVLHADLRGWAQIASAFPFRSSTTCEIAPAFSRRSRLYIKGRPT